MRLFLIAIVLLAPLSATPARLAVIWRQGVPAGTASVLRGSFAEASAGKDPARTEWTAGAGGGTRLTLAIEPEAGSALPTLVTITAGGPPFTVRVDDVQSDQPVWLPDDGVIVTAADDTRDYAAVVAALQSLGGRTKLQKLESAPETTFATAAERARQMRTETWLGIARDDRIFRVDAHLDWIEPHLAGRDLRLPETEQEQVNYACTFGRGWGVRETLRRRLADGVLPILEATLDDDDVRYEVTLLVTLEKQPLTDAAVQGTDHLLADSHGHGAMFTPAQHAALAALRARPPAGEETVLRGRVRAINRGSAPAYAFFRAPTPTAKKPVSWTFDASAGLGILSSGRVFLSGTLDGAPLPATEVSSLLRPGQVRTWEFSLPHQPVPRERAEGLGRPPFSTHEAQARAYWQARLAAGARWQLPETHMDERVRAGLLHLDLVGYGREPDGPVLPAIGIYTAIGSESAPIIQFMDTMGRPGIAARMIDHFLVKQHESGFMQNFNGYMLETGAVLWTMGEHYRYTRDEAWLRRVHPNLTRACSFIRDWRRRNLQPELAGDGYGLLDGKTADPEDPYRSFMLNGYAYLGLARAAEMLRELAPAESAAWAEEAQSLRRDIRASLEGALARGPVVPLGDGRWSRSAAPWTRYRGPVMLHTDGGRWYTHWSITSRDSLLGPLYLVFQEVIDPAEPLASTLLEVHSALMTQDNVAFTQPYYSRHPWVHLVRGETKAFLQAWYTALAGLSDRETYTFAEHFFPVSAHKTHEEAWFLMETRWMLYREAGTTLHLLGGIPRRYLESGKSIGVENGASYFGPLSFRVSAPDSKTLEATIECRGPRAPARISLRMPHPSGRAARHVEGGQYDAARETVEIPLFTGKASVLLRFE